MAGSRRKITPSPQVGSPCPHSLLPAALVSCQLARLRGARVVPPGPAGSLWAMAVLSARVASLALPEPLVPQCASWGSSQPPMPVGSSFCRRCTRRRCAPRFLPGTSQPLPECEPPGPPVHPHAGDLPGVPRLPSLLPRPHPRTCQPLPSWLRSSVAPPEVGSFLLGSLWVWRRECGGCHCTQGSRDGEEDTAWRTSVASRWWTVSRRARSSAGVETPILRATLSYRVSVASLLPPFLTYFDKAFL